MNVVLEPQTKITFIKDDGYIGIDEYALLDIDKAYFNWVPQNVHAFHWFGDEHGGEIEYSQQNPFDQKPPNERIYELGIWDNLIKVFNEEYQRREDARLAEIAYIESNKDYWEELRILRDYRLTLCDWTQLPDAQLTETQVSSWGVYRQELRDLPQIITDPKPLVNDPDNPSWPVPPS